MNQLLRGLAPITEAAWQEIDDEARTTLKLTMAARKLVDFVGPLGWHASAVSSGRTRDAAGGPLPGGVDVRVREVQPLVELTRAFELSRDELEVLGRGGRDADLSPVTEAARALAMAEDRAVFHGHAAAGIVGVDEAAARAALTLTDDFARYPRVVAEAVSRLRSAGVTGPYGIALGPRCYKGLTETTTSGGYRVFDHVQRLLDGPVVWAPGVDGAVVLSLRGGDFELTVGQDVSVGYLGHTDATVRLYLRETMTFRVLAAEAAVPLAYEASATGRT